MKNLFKVPNNVLCSVNSYVSIGPLHHVVLKSFKRFFILTNLCLNSGSHSTPSKRAPEMFFYLNKIATVVEQFFTLDRTILRFYQAKRDFQIVL